MINRYGCFRSSGFSLATDKRGAAAMEFALVIPLLSLMLFGIMQFGIAYNQRIALTDASRAAVRELAVGRQSATAYSDTVTRFRNSASNLDQGRIVLRMFVAGAQCGSNGACQTALNGSTGLPARLEASYPCNLTILGFDFAPGCTLTSVTTQRVE